MQSFYDYKKFAILYVDDEEKSLKYFDLAFGKMFRIFTATNAQDGFRLLEEHQDGIGLLITDQRMPGEKGVQLLERARQLRPRMIRILATAYSDLDAAIAAVNTGAIYKYITKPWDVPQLEATLKRGLEFFIVQQERDQLLREKLSVLHNIVITDRVVSLGIVAAGLGHYVRNSLVAVRTFLDLAPAKLQEENVDLEELRNPNFWKEFYAHVQTQVNRIGELLTDLGTAADPQPFAFDDQIQLGSFITDAVNRAQERLQAKHVTVENNIPGDLPALRVDGRKFQRLFDLLLKDEITSLPEGGRITLAASASPGAEGQSGRVRLELCDNGQGLPKDALRSVFDPFFVRADDPQEFGINLMTCYFIVFHHGGTINVLSEGGKGTTFILEFPTQPPLHPKKQDEQEFLSKVLLNDALWERLLAGG